MKKIECPSCAMRIDATSANCPICGYEFPRQSRLTQWVAVLLVVVLLYFMLF